MGFREMPYEFKKNRDFLVCALLLAFSHVTQVYLYATQNVFWVEAAHFLCTYQSELLANIIGPAERSLLKANPNILQETQQNSLCLIETSSNDQELANSL